MKLSAPVPRTMEGQLIAVFGASFVILFGLMFASEWIGRQSASDVAKSEATIDRLRSIKQTFDALTEEEAAIESEIRSTCHFGYTVSEAPDPIVRGAEEDAQIQFFIADSLAIDSDNIAAGYRNVTRTDFSFAECANDEIKLPSRSLIVSLLLENGAWLNAEVHPHEWHYAELVALWLRYAAIFLLVGGVAIFFVRRIGEPLRQLTNAIHRFGKGLEVSHVAEIGPADVAEAIRSFNQMQRRVKAAVEDRIKSLAAISHDIRSPLTSLRLKAELVDDPEARSKLLGSIKKMEQITNSALDQLRADIRNDSSEQVDLARLIIRECQEMERDGLVANYTGPKQLSCVCKPNLIVRAIRNLVDNANKYADGAKVELRNAASAVEIRVVDNGPGISPQDISKAKEPFQRLSDARDASVAGFGLGLSIAESVALAHGGHLDLESDIGTGLTVILTLNLS